MIQIGVLIFIAVLLNGIYVCYLYMDTSNVSNLHYITHLRNKDKINYCD